jgi:hypothetical protein
VGVQRVHDGVQQRILQVRRVGELLLAVAGGLSDQGVVLRQLALEHAVHVGELVVVGQLAFEQAVRLEDDLHQAGALLLLHRAAAHRVHRRQLAAAVLVQAHRLPALVLQGMVGQHHLGQIHRVALAAEVKQRNQALAEQEAFLDAGVAVVEDLAQEGIEAHEHAHVALEQLQVRPQGS